MKPSTSAFRMQVQCIRFEFDEPVTLTQDDEISLNWQMDYAGLRLLDVKLNGESIKCQPHYYSIEVKDDP